jgi:hypothetical protein
MQVTQNTTLQDIIAQLPYTEAQIKNLPYVGFNICGVEVSFIQTKFSVLYIHTNLGIKLQIINSDYKRTTRKVMYKGGELNLKDVEKKINELSIISQEENAIIAEQHKEAKRRAMQRAKLMEKIGLEYPDNLVFVEDGEYKLTLHVTEEEIISIYSQLRRGKGYIECL